MILILFLNKENLSKYLSKRKVNLVKIKSKRTIFQYLQFVIILFEIKKNIINIFFYQTKFCKYFIFSYIIQSKLDQTYTSERNHIDEFKYNKSFKIYYF